MDTAPVSPASAMPTQVPVRSGTHRTLIVALLAGLVATLVILFAVWRGGALNGGLPEGYQLTLAARSLPLIPMRTIDTRKGQLPQVSVEGQGAAVIVDSVRAQPFDYYLIADPGLKRVNLYRYDDAHPHSGLSELTHSSTVKYDLSYDALSNTAAFTVLATSTGTHVALFTEDGKEKDLGAGEQPTVLPGGFFVVFRQGNSIISLNTQTKASHTLLTAASSTPFAVNAEKKVLALYEPATKSVQYFSLAGMTGASFLGSSKMPAEPVSFTFVGEKAYGVMQGSGVAVDPVQQEITLPAATLAASRSLKITTRHD